MSDQQQRYKCTSEPSSISAEAELEAERDALKAERDELLADVDEQTGMWLAAKNRAEAAEAEVRRLREALDKLLGPKCPCKCSDEPWHQRGVCRDGEAMLMSSIAPTPPEGQP